MARKKKGEGEQGSEAETAKQIKAPADLSKHAVISQSKLVNLMKMKRGAKKDTGEINGRVGEAIAAAAENHNLHRKAFAVIMTLDNMEPEKIADFLDHFNYYLDISGINKRAESVMRMNLGEGEGSDDDGEPAETNVTKFPAAAGTA